jgi:hypothetical protein
MWNTLATTRECFAKARECFVSLDGGTSPGIALVVFEALDREVKHVGSYSRHRRQHDLSGMLQLERRRPSTPDAVAYHQSGRGIGGARRSNSRPG